MGHLTQYTHDLTRNKMDHGQLLPVVEELQKQISVLSGDLSQLRKMQGKIRA